MVYSYPPGIFACCPIEPLPSRQEGKLLNPEVLGPGELASRVRESGIGEGEVVERGDKSV